MKYRSVGNENWGRHELGARTVQEWGPLVRESAKLMRSVTRDAKLFAAATSNKGWSLPLLKEAGWTLDYNDRGDEHVRPEAQTFRVRKSAVQIPAHSITFLTIE